MTPKDKAGELIHKFYSSYEGRYSEDMNAKECALIAVDFALDYVNGDLNEAFDKTLYLLEVKEEIEKL